MIISKNKLLISFLLNQFFAPVFAQTDDKKINIVTSIPYLTDILSNTTCNSKSINVDTLIPLGNDPHHFHITKKERISIEKSNLVIIIGAEFEPWATKIKKNSKQNWLVVTEGMELKKIASDNHSNHDHNDHTEHDDHHHHEHSQLEYDPHIWQSPARTKIVAHKIALELKKQLPAEAKNIDTCLKSYTLKIDEEVKELKKQIDNLPAQKRKFATNHDALGYFADEFGFKIKSIVGLSDESSPTAARLKEIITEIKQENIPAVFLETTGNMRNIKTVSKETGVKIGGTLYSDSLGAKGSGAETAVDMWKTNVKTILEALKE
ncbi:metal ABC transporter substrate-binding protein [Pigmentibacter sp. JX0631]|uniref:metal ABC transporter substrate-binding protein n=1 Tax=Pigmentibacter sp. JX0631 TaxID=2976982 RepID=UPI002468C2F5|nr:metal ABC transporter substrate-binding protein [Pigmentibacter sp. JX0631]WGL60164.1 metal ABC transporter substrate-binding protein [Pigmentibacter sp. JX0631]